MAGGLTGIVSRGDVVVVVVVVGGVVGGPVCTYEVPVQVHCRRARRSGQQRGVLGLE